MINQGKVFRKILQEKNISQEKAAELLGVSRGAIQYSFGKNILDDSLIESIVKNLHCPKDLFFNDPLQEKEKKYNVLLQKYSDALELINKLRDELEKVKEENIYEPGTIEHTLSVYRKSSKIADQRINSLEEENEEFRSELIELRTKIRKYEGR